MRKLGLFIMLTGFLLTLISTWSYFSDRRHEKTEFATKVLPVAKSFPLNLPPLIGLTIMGIGGVVVWSTYNNN